MKSVFKISICLNEKKEISISSAWGGREGGRWRMVGEGREVGECGESERLTCYLTVSPPLTFARLLLRFVTFRTSYVCNK